ncbi:hypothetical protein [Flavonifractor sp. An52]|uniref:hypothetical protein n=1 Tax=Flavonifractor sp. An52 TaxID=1965642 RepID=UPI001FA91C43|nr:hypothetical protein [Flavonifractor sp. An52]
MEKKIPNGEARSAAIKAMTASAATKTTPPTNDTNALTSAATAFVTATAAFLESSAAALAVCLDFCSILRWAAVCAFRRARSITCLAAGVPAVFRAVVLTALVDTWADLSIAFRVLGVNAPPGGFSFGPEERRGRSLMDGLMD